MATRDIIVIGASAGGVQALSKLVADLPHDLPAAVFIVLHIPSHAPSFLPSILTRDASLPVAHAQDGQKIEQLERFPHYVMVLNAEDLTIHAVNPAYKQLLGDRNVVGLPMSEVFSGTDLDNLIKVIKQAVREGQSIKTSPMRVSVDEDTPFARGLFTHTVVPIIDADGSSVNRVFIYSESAE